MRVRSRQSYVLLCVAMMCVVISANRALAQPFAIDWSSIDCGGGTATGGSFSLTGTIGQPDAGGPMTGGAFSLSGGFLAGSGGSPCPADFNNTDGLNVQDIFDYLNAWFLGCP